MKRHRVSRFVGIRTPAFTLLELLVVIAIIGILAALLLPALRGVKQQAEGIRRLGNLKQFSFAWNLYADDHDERIVLNHGRPGPFEPRSNIARAHHRASQRGQSIVSCFSRVSRLPAGTPWSATPPRHPNLSMLLTPLRHYQLVGAANVFVR